MSFMSNFSRVIGDKNLILFERTQRLNYKKAEIVNIANSYLELGAGYKINFLFQDIEYLYSDKNPIVR